MGNVLGLGPNGVRTFGCRALRPIRFFYLIFVVEYCYKPTIRVQRYSMCLWCLFESLVLKTNPNPNKIMGNIPVRISSHSAHNKNKTRVNNTRNASACIHTPLITSSSNGNNNRPMRPNLPSFSLLNARSLFPKLNELTALLMTNPVDIVAVTETWLHKDINDGGPGSGVCVYISKSIPCQRRTELESANFECIWLWIRPPRLPRLLTGIILCVVYNPPDRSEQEALTNHLVNTTDSLRNKYPDCALAILGDFNSFGAPNLLSGHNLKQVVHLPTRRSATLDLIISELHTLYHKPTWFWWP